MRVGSPGWVWGPNKKRKRAELCSGHTQAPRKSWVTTRREDCKPGRELAPEADGSHCQRATPDGLEQGPRLSPAHASPFLVLLNASVFLCTRLTPNRPHRRSCHSPWDTVNRWRVGVVPLRHFPPPDSDGRSSDGGCGGGPDPHGFGRSHIFPSSQPQRSQGDNSHVRC